MVDNNSEREGGFSLPEGGEGAARDCLISVKQTNTQTSTKLKNRVKGRGCVLKAQEILVSFLEFITLLLQKILKEKLI